MFYHCATHEVILEEDTYGIIGRPEQRCARCAENGVDQIVDSISDDEIDPGIFDFLVERKQWIKSRVESRS
jgi:hypothetical protein